MLASLKWTFTFLTALVLLGWALSPWPEIQIGRGRSLQMADGFLTVRIWTGERAAPGVPSDMAPDGGIPDTWNIPLWFVLVGLAVPAAVLWAWGRRENGHGPFFRCSERARRGGV